MPSMIEVLSWASGLDEKKVREIAAEGMENRVRLDACDGPHAFTISAGKRAFADDFICEKCGGRVSNLHKLWYEKGLAHGKRNS